MTRYQRSVRSEAINVSDDRPALQNPGLPRPAMGVGVEMAFVWLDTLSETTCILAKPSSTPTTAKHPTPPHHPNPPSLSSAPSITFRPPRFLVLPHLSVS